MHRPTALPRMPASASGVSKHRSGPKRSRNPAVARKTPPARPTSSPITITDGSRSSSTWKQSLIASTMESSAKRPPQLVQVRPERGRRINKCVLEQELDIRGRLSLRRRDARAERFECLRANRSSEIVVQDPCAAQVALEATDALALLLLLDSLEVDVRARIVGRRVRRRPVRDRLDERRSLAGAPTHDRLTRGLIAGEHVRAVDTQAGHPVADRLVGERLGTRLRLERRRDRPVVVVAE